MSVFLPASDRTSSPASLASALAFALGTGLTTLGAFSVLPETASAAPARIASTIPVTNCDNEGVGSLRAAAAAAISGDTIDLSGLDCSLITFTTGAVELGVDTVEIRGRPTPLLTVDGNLTSRALNHSGAGTLTVSNLNIVRGRIVSDDIGATARGGCINSIGAVTLDHVLLSDCQVTAVGSVETPGVAEGGAVAASSFAMSDSSIENSAALIPTASIGNAFGGAICSNGNVDVIRSTLSGNSAIGLHGAAWGGAVISLGGDTTIINSTLSTNLTQGYPYLPSTGSFNQQQAMGGAVAISSSYYTLLSISGSTLSGNSSSSGGAIAVDSFSPNSVQIINSTISGNEATSMGGGVWQTYGALTVSNSTIAFNSAVYGGGGIMPRHDFLTGIYNYSPVLQSTIVSNNSSNYYEADIFSRMSQLPVNGSHNLIVSTNLSLPADTIALEPQLLPLGDNGGPTLTHELSDTSPAIDSADNPLGLPFDQRADGHPRLQGAATDIGAVEHAELSDVIFEDGFD